MKEVDVSVVIVNYNTFDLTSKCIQSIYDHTQGCTFEIVLVDNASTERSARDFLDVFPDVIVIENSFNSGFAKGNNIGITRASGEVVLLLNSDAELKNNALGICRHVLSQNEKVGVVASRLEYPDGRVQHNCQRFPSVRASLFEFFRLQKVLPGGVGAHTLFGSFFRHDEMAYPDWVWGTFFMFRKRDLSSLPAKKLDDRFFMYVEDMQWCLDFRRAGFEVCFEPRARVVHHMGKSGGKKNSLMVENTNTFMEQNYFPFHRWFIRLIHKVLVV
jgi:GT2 family glycosyltransferase